MIDFAVVRNLTLAMLLYGAVFYLSGGTRAEAQMHETAPVTMNVASNSATSPER